ncbi:membrane protein [Geobacillus genomosp. 3]|uniref:membrane protein n=1 Tax=Geobacillus genomosp. 3 TaxID=1921421 RepID=UPI00059DCFDE|nr:membrane protein [Geobacillus genomosp. 3]
MSNVFPTRTGTETDVRLPFSFIMFAVLAFAVSQLMLLWAVPALSGGTFRLPLVWAAAHLGLLGFALMTAMGAMYQLVPVAFLTPIWSERLGFWQFAVTATGIVAFAVSLAVAPNQAFLPGLLLLLGIVLFVWQMAMTLRKQETKNVMTLFVATSLLFLLLTAAAGGMLAFHFFAATGANSHESVFGLHVLFGLCGWFTLLIMGFSYKMAPMFSLAHGFSLRPARYVYALYTGGIAVAFASLFSPNKAGLAVGAALLMGGFAVFAWHIRAILQKRMKKTLDRPFQFSVTAVAIGLALHAAAVIAIIAGSGRWLGIILYLSTIGWIGFSIIGYLFKIVPFLWWTHRYSEKVGQQNVPTLKQMMNERAITIQCRLWLAALALAAVALAVASVPLLAIAQVLLAGLSVAFAGTILAVFRK